MVASPPPPPQNVMTFFFFSFLSARSVGMFFFFFSFKIVPYPTPRNDSAPVSSPEKGCIYDSFPSVLLDGMLYKTFKI